MRIGRVYKIVSNLSNRVYVGSTFNTLKQCYDLQVFQYQRKGTGCKLFERGVESCRIELLKEYEVLDEAHLNVYESLWIVKLNAINCTLPCGQMLNRKRVRCECDLEMFLTGYGKHLKSTHHINAVYLRRRSRKMKDLKVLEGNRFQILAEFDA